MGCSVLEMVIVASVCRQQWGCNLKYSNGEGLHLASAKRVWVGVDSDRALYIHPSASPEDFRVDDKKVDYKKTASPLLGLPLAEIPLTSGQSEAVISASRGVPDIHVAVCDKSGNSETSFLLLPYSRAVSSGWRNGYWFFALPLFVVVLFYDKNEVGRSVAYAAAFTDALLWAAKITACVYYSSLSLENGIMMGGLELLAILVTSFSRRSNTTGVALLVALLSFATSFTYYTPLAILSTCLFN